MKGRMEGKRKKAWREGEKKIDLNDQPVYH